MRRAISLLVRPAARWSSTSPSRAVRGSQPGNQRCRLEPGCANSSMAASIRSTMSRVRNGFSMKSAAPLLMASTAMAMLPFVAVTSTGAMQFSSRRRLSTSRPERSGGISSSTQAGIRALASESRDAPSAKQITWYALCWSAVDNCSRQAASVSMTNTSPLESMFPGIIPIQQCLWSKWFETAAGHHRVAPSYAPHSRPCFGFTYVCSTQFPDLTDRDINFTFRDICRMPAGTGRMTDLIRSAGLSYYPEVARSVGLDPKQMMRKVRLPLACLDKPDTPIAVTGLRRLLELSAEASGAEDFGLRLAERGGVTQFWARRPVWAEQG